MNLAQVDPQRRVSVAEDAITAADAAHQRQCRRPPVLSARDALTALQFEALLVSVAACNVISGEELTEEDLARLLLAARRIDCIVAEVNS